jgi:hypothetical protein
LQESDAIIAAHFQPRAAAQVGDGDGGRGGAILGIRVAVVGNVAGLGIEDGVGAWDSEGTCSIIHAFAPLAGTKELLSVSLLRPRPVFVHQWL